MNLTDLRKRDILHREGRWFVTISVLNLQDKLTDNEEALRTVLIHLGFFEDRIKYNERQHLITSTRPEIDADNTHGFLLYTDSLRYLFTTRSGEGNIFTLVMELKQVNFPKALELIGKWIGYKGEDIKRKLPFGGFYKEILREQTEPEQYLKEYKEDDLPMAGSLSEQFLKDGIALDIQERWGIRIDFTGNNILIPIHDYTGRLIGCKARNNDKYCSFDKRWFAYLPYSKTAVVYGYFENYAEIQKKKLVFIFESEKSVLQCASFGCHTAVAIGGHTISTTQARYIKSLLADRVILAFDSDIIAEELEYEAKKLLSDNNILNNNVGYICDKEHSLLGEKDSPSDYGKQPFADLVKNCVTWL